MTFQHDAVTIFFLNITVSTVKLLRQHLNQQMSACHLRHSPDPEYAALNLVGWEVGQSPVIRQCFAIHSIAKMVGAEMNEYEMKLFKFTITIRC